MKNFLYILLVLGLTQFTVSCGVKGPLYMPPEPPDPVAEAKNRAKQLKKEKLLAVKDCAVVLDDDEREWCFELHDEREEALKVCDLIVDEENEKLCRKDVLGNAYKEDPYLEEAKNKCDAIKDEDKKLSCIEEVNEKTLDEEAIEKCNLIIDDSQRDTCLADYRIKKKKRLETKDAYEKLKLEEENAQPSSDIMILDIDGKETDLEGQKKTNRDNEDLLYRNR